MAGPILSLEGVTRRFGSVAAVDAVSLDLAENEFFALLGPSGCGKTTLLRIVAGFEQPDEGRVLLEGREITQLRPRHRPINLMFQSFALFPHMTVERNVAYGLEMENLPRAEVRRRVAEVLETTELSRFARRRPAQLSGGQRQRVALARALVKRPRLLLLDEPLGALDRKLREQMQLELKRLQSEVGITFVVVTHDQEEALVMADRIALMQEGRIAQLGAPHDLYERPASRFVAAFIGQMNFLEGRAAPGGVEVPGLGLLRAGSDAAPPAGAPAVLAVRPERLLISTAGPGGDERLDARVVDLAYHGQDVMVHLALEPGGQRLVARQTAAAFEALGLAPGQAVALEFRAAEARVLPAERQETDATESKGDAA